MELFPREYMHIYNKNPGSGIGACNTYPGVLDVKKKIQDKEEVVGEKKQWKGREGVG